jgi:signal peptidase I
MSENEEKEQPFAGTPDGRPEATDRRGEAGERMNAGSGSTKAKNEAWEWTKAFLIALALVVIIRHFLFETYIVDGPSMRPNFDSGERLIVNKILYDFRDPKRGEVIVFHATEEKDFIKRIIALPGETIKVDKDEVYINGQLLDEPYIQEEVEKMKKEGKTYNDLSMPEMTVPEGAVFVMGDNRSDSTDSRMIGPIPYDQIVGRADIVLWPPKRIQIVH